MDRQSASPVAPQGGPLGSLPDLPLPQGAASSGAGVEPTSTPSRAGRSDHSSAKPLDYPRYGDPFVSPLMRIIKKVPGLKSIIHDGENEDRPDSRVEVSLSDLALLPCSAICRIHARYERGGNDWWLGSGFLAAPGAVVTAAHVVWHDVHGRAVEIKVWPGWHRDNPQEYQGRAWHWCDNWPRTWLSDWDYGIVLLDDADTRARHGEIPLQELPTETWQGLIAERKQFMVAGYPGDKEDSGTQWRGNGRIVGQRSQIVRHVCDTEKGESGSPVLGKFGGRIRAIAVHSKGESTFNIARKLNTDFHHDFARWTGSA